MQRSRWIRRATRIGAILLVVYALGLVSSLVSRPAAIRDTELAAQSFLAGSENGKNAARLSRADLVDRFAERPIPREELVGSYRTLARLLPLRLLEPREARPAWTYQLASVTPWPFIVRLHYGRYAAYSYGSCGSAGTRVYVGGFGKAVLLGEWPSVMW